MLLSYYNQTNEKGGCIMDEQKFEKTLKDAKWFSIILLVLSVIIFVLSYKTMNTISIISSIIQLALLLGAAMGCSKRMMYGPVCGVVVAILMIISLSILDIILGILFLIECINLIKYMKK